MNLFLKNEMQKEKKKVAPKKKRYFLGQLRPVIKPHLQLSNYD